MTRVLVVAEHHKDQLVASTKAVLGAAQGLTNECDVLLVSDNDAVTSQIALLENVKSVLLLQHARFSHILAEDLAPVVVNLAKDYTHILAPSTTFGKNFMPRVAAMLNVGQISDVIAIENEDTFKRPIYAGNAIERVKSRDAIKVLTIRPTVFKQVNTRQIQAEIIKLSDFQPFEKVQFIAEQTPELTRPELTAAKVIIAGGRGLKSKENFKLLEEIADKLGAAIGASRAAVDAGFVPNDFQVGQTGKVVAPDLYIAVGISGAIQHLAGMKDSKVIVAINKDPDAPIFQVADYGLVGDLFEILPELTQQL